MVSLFHLTCFVQLSYLRLSKGYNVQKLLSEFLKKGIDSLLKKILLLFFSKLEVE